MKKLLVVLSVAVVSTLAIMCRSASDVSYAKTPDLRQVVQVESAVTNVVNGGIRAGFEDWICPPEWPRRVFVHRGMRVIDPDPESRKATIADLQLLRDLVSRRADEAFQAGANSASFSELLQVKDTGNTIDANLRGPQSVGNVR
jgi:hypothetical protein